MSRSVIVHESFLITGRGAIVFIEHHEQGLPAGTKLTSFISGLVWSVKQRITHVHVGTRHKKLHGETESVMWEKFASTEKMHESATKILEDESRNIYEYFLIPDGHDTKPAIGEELIISEMLMSDPNLVQYYKDRAKEYDKLYARPDRQEDLHKAAEHIKTIFAGKNVFEVACGTGWWTQKIAETAQSIIATDINAEMLEVAKTKQYGPATVSFAIHDLYAPAINKHENLFAGFFWSHILLQDLDRFIDTINSHVVSGGTVVFIDNRFAEGSNLPIAETDAQGNTYQLRTLDNGKQHKVLKNFPTEEQLKNVLMGKALDVKFNALPYYWILEYKTT